VGEQVRGKKHTRLQRKSSSTKLYAWHVLILSGFRDIDIAKLVVFGVKKS
jgi:hypothetical protein